MQESNMPKITYTKKDLIIIVSMLQDAVNELEEWSEENNKEYAAHIESMQIVINDIEFNSRRQA